MKTWYYEQFWDKNSSYIDDPILMIIFSFSVVQYPSYDIHPLHITFSKIFKIMDPQIPTMKRLITR